MREPGKLIRSELAAARRLIMRQAVVEQPEQRLWAAVLRMAINDIPERPYPDTPVVRYFNEYQFAPAAEFLDLEPDFVVESLRKVGALPTAAEREAA